MATCTTVCGVCDLRHQTSTSTHWCIECEEPLCSDCREYHNVLKATRIHKTISISEYQLLPSAVTDIKQHCIYHNEKYQLYCIKHESPICNKCVKDHGKCGEVLSLDEMVKDIKTSEYVNDLEQSLDDIFTNINLIRKNRESNIESIKDQRKKIAAEVCHLKKQVIQHINKIEEGFIKELNQIEFNCCDTIQSIVSSLQDQAKKVNQLKLDIKNTKKYASELQTFLNMSEIQAKTTEYEKHLQSITENKNLQEITLESAIDSQIHDMLMVDIFGSINVRKNPSSNIDLKRKKDRQAQILVPTVIKVITDGNFKLQRKLNTACKYPFGCCITKNGEFLFTNYEDSNDKIVAINAEGDVVYTIPLTEPYGTYDVTCLDESAVAVSAGHSIEEPGISIVDLTKRKVKTFISLPDNPFGITYDGKSLICCVQGTDLHVISCTDYSITTIPNTASLQFSYVSTHADKIFFTNPDKHTVTCCLYSGELVWKFNDESVLDSPQGITIDDKGNVFVAGIDSCNVVVIFPEGKHNKQILTKEDGLDRPTTIYFDKVRKQLLVTNQELFANIFNISYS